MPPKQNLSGRSFGLLSVISEVKGHDRVKWLCKCVCGRTTITQTCNLLNGHTRSCGHCVRTKHGESHTALYKVWAVRVCSTHGCCDEWRDYNTFKGWAIAHGWRKGLWVHRKADRGEYSPLNCFIAPRHFQAACGQSRSAKLLPSDIPEIRRLAQSGMTPASIGAIYNAKPRTIRDVLNNVTWKHITSIPVKIKAPE